MNTKAQRQWLEYWRRSLKDSQKSDIEIEAFQEKDKVDGRTRHNYILIDNFSPASESIPPYSIDKCREILKRLKASETDVFISPLLIKRTRKQHSAFSPFWYMAHINEDGQLSIPEDTMPIVPRKYLSPVYDNASGEYFIFGDLDTAESAIAIDHDGQFEEYGDYIGYVSEVFKFITGMEFGKYASKCMKERSFGEEDCFVAYSHTITSSTAIILFPPDEKNSKNAGKFILELYNYLCAQSEYPALLSKMISGETKTSPFLPDEDWIRLNAKHLGQMKADYPLSYSQRRSLYTILNQWDKPVHVVNGPPGTGKTTLLQSIVANMVVNSAIEGEPCIIWGLAATNQAVTNIIDSFSKGGQDIRWLPTNSSYHGGYGTYFPSSRVSSENLRDINFIGLKETGTFAEIENQEYLAIAKSKYIEHAQSYFSHSKITDVVGVLIKLNSEIRAYKKVLTEITNSAQSLVRLSSIFPKYWDNGTLLSAIIEKDLFTYRKKLASVDRNIELLNKSEQECIEELKDAKGNYAEAESIIKKYNTFLKQIRSQKSHIIDRDTHTPFLIKIFFGKKNHEKNVIRIEQLNQQIEQYEYKKNDARKSFVSMKEEIIAIDEKLNNIKSQIDRKQSERSSIVSHIKTIKQLPAEAGKWGKAIERLHLKDIPLKETSIPQLGKYEFYDELDKLRAKLFALSIRYWEGRWLLETEDAIKNNDDNKYGKDSVKSRLRRYAMLTPCFVSTFHSAPKNLSYRDKGSSKWQYLTDYVDCLIIDEAGQASPEISMALFALAKRAVVVGDVKQIEPVWSILDSVDSANLAKYGLNSNGSSDFNGRRCSCGSIMRIAQAACTVKDDSIDEKGNILLEHRRCLPEIIQYCSDLAYNGLIIPMRKDKETIFPKMAFFNVRSSVTTKQGNKRANPEESRAVCEWLRKNQRMIEHEYGKGEKDPNEVAIEKYVGILTPFRGQKEQLYQDLKTFGFNADGFKMGTVHALQGAERPIVLFSSVYTAADNVGKKFFDENVNMLNVAVSRAKDSFILFGDERIFKDMKTPSGKLFEIVRKNQLSNYSKSLTTAKVESVEYDIFISFSSKDQVIVDRINAYLKAHDHGLKVFMSRDDLIYHDAESFRVGLGRALQHSKMMLFVLSNNFVHSRETRNEWNTGVDSLRLPKLLFQIDKAINWTEDDDNVRFFVSATGNGGQAIQAYDSIEEKLSQLLKEINGVLGNEDH